MFRYGILARIFIALLIIGLLTAGGAALYRFAWAQGYQAAAVSAAASGQGAQGTPNQVAPYGGPWGYAPYGYGPHWGPGFGFFPFFPLFGFGFFILFLFLIGGLFRGMGYRRWGGGPGYWQHEHQQPPEEKKEG